MRRIRSADEHVAAILDSLLSPQRNEGGMNGAGENNTMEHSNVAVLITADHGIGYGQSYYEQSANARRDNANPPLIVALPKQFTDRCERRRRGRAREGAGGRGRVREGGEAETRQEKVQRERGLHLKAWTLPRTRAPCL